MRAWAILTLTLTTLLLLATNLAAQTTYVWTGLGTDNNWSNPDNWDQSSIPNSNHDVVIFDATGVYVNDTIKLDQSVTVGVIEYNRTAGNKLTIDPTSSSNIITFHSEDSQSYNVDAFSGDGSTTRASIIFNNKIELYSSNNNDFAVKANTASVVFNDTVGTSSASGAAANIGMKLEAEDADTSSLSFIAFNAGTTGNVTTNSTIDEGYVLVQGNSVLGFNNTAVFRITSKDEPKVFLVATDNATATSELDIKYNFTQNSNRDEFVGVSAGKTFTWVDSKWTASHEAGSSGVADINLYVDTTQSSDTGTGTFSLTDFFNLEGIAEIKLGATDDNPVILEMNPSDGTNQVYENAIKGTGDISKIGAGTSEVKNMQNDGTTTISDGIFNLNSNGNVDTTKFVVNGDDAIFQKNGSEAKITTIELINGEIQLVNGHLETTTFTQSGGTTSMATDSNEITTFNHEANAVTISGESSTISTYTKTGGTLEVTGKDNHFQTFTNSADTTTIAAKTTFGSLTASQEDGSAASSVTFASGSDSSTVGTLRVEDTASVTINSTQFTATNTDVTGGTLTVNGTLNNLGTLTQSGGTVTLAGDASDDTETNGIENLNMSGGLLIISKNASITQTVNVTGGTLQMDTESFTGASITFSGDGIASGTGKYALSVDGKFNMNDGTLAPGNSIGTLTVEYATSTTMDLSQTSFDFEIAAPGTSDLFVVETGSIDLGTAFEFDQFEFEALSGFAPGNYYLLHTPNGDINHSFTQLDGIVGIYESYLEVVTNQDGFSRDALRLVVTTTVIPEPSGASLLLLTLAAASAYRRRKA